MADVSFKQLLTDIKRRVLRSRSDLRNRYNQGHCEHTLRVRRPNLSNFLFEYQVLMNLTNDGATSNRCLLALVDIFIAKQPRNCNSPPGGSRCAHYSSDRLVSPHRYCGEQCNFDCINFKGDEYAPLYGTADQLLIHTEYKFQLACAAYWNDPEFSESADHAFCTTPDHDKGLREIVCKTISEHMVLLRKPEIEAPMAEFNGLAFRLLKEKADKNGWLNLVTTITLLCYLLQLSIRGVNRKQYLKPWQPHTGHLTVAKLVACLPLHKSLLNIRHGILSTPRMAESSAERVLKLVKNCLTSGDYSDLIITCGSDVHNVHKMIVCTQADFFARAVKFGGKEAEESRVDLPDDEPAIITLLLQYLYEGEYDPNHMVAQDSTLIASRGASSIVINRGERRSSEYGVY
ncbi:hypothetical protein P153DRAFT_427383 [Dothidotthia symphoricarpi CBS 119687]|uniref:BTB domain-containing protein n=1 Tax=Dothidotthia symphoricarpi CBS 119687 TaxID=1392245 RepID=A0A6A6AV57_9PLEO|nr:uncharacterized protein P153DRAFT_427383 [Dothidotthia symphoricarpi CBS 119687]KAF2134737.1 hypothetical protein P153DRAFT_427383 [Dothidotthia symphoricarpi CBS 119687]